MTVSINDVDTEIIIGMITSSDGDVNLATERLNTLLGNPYGYIKEYAFQTRLAQLDLQTSDQLASRLRTLLTVKLYHLISLATIQLQGDLCNLRPAELARTHASLTNSFASLTSGSTKITFDFNSEIEKIAAEFPDIPVEDIKTGIKEMSAKLSTVNTR